MTAIVSIISRCGLTIEACHSNQPNKSKLTLCKPLLHCNRHLKQLYIIVTRWNASVIKVGVAYVGVHILRYLKEELVWATNKWLGLFVIYNSYTTKELRIKLFYV